MISLLLLLYIDLFIKMMLSYHWLVGISNFVRHCGKKLFCNNDTKLRGKGEVRYEILFSTISGTEFYVLLRGAV